MKVKFSKSIQPEVANDDMTPKYLHRKGSTGFIILLLSIGPLAADVLLAMLWIIPENIVKNKIQRVFF